MKSQEKSSKDKRESPWEDLTLWLVFIFTLVSIYYVMSEPNPTYEFPEDFNITKAELDSLYKQTGNPIKLCKVDGDFCLLIHKIENGG